MTDSSDNVPPSTDPRSELDAALVEAEVEFAENGSPELSEREWTDAAERGKREFRSVSATAVRVGSTSRRRDYYGRPLNRQ